MRVFALLVLLAATSASAQPTDSSTAPSGRPAWLTVSPQVSYLLRDGDGNFWDLLGGSVRSHHLVGTFVAEIGVSGGGEVFGRRELLEAHVGLGKSVSVGPLFATATAGPSIGRAYSRFSRRTVVVLGATATVETELVLFPAFGIGAEAFVHVNAVEPTAGFGLTLAFGRLPGAVFPNPPATPRRPGP